LNLKVLNVNLQTIDDMDKFNNRPKAFWGAVISAAGSLLGTGLSAIAANKQAKREAREQRYQRNIQEAASLNDSFNNTEYIDDFRDRFSFKLGGNVAPRKESKPAVNFKDRLPKLRVRGSQR